MKPFHILVQCCFCPRCFMTEATHWDVTPTWRVEKTIWCPFCDTRIVGIRIDNQGRVCKGRELEVIPVADDQIEYMEKQKVNGQEKRK